MKRLIASIAASGLAVVVAIGAMTPNVGAVFADDPQSVAPLAARYGFVGTVFANTSPDLPTTDRGDDSIAVEFAFHGESVGMSRLVNENAIGPYVGTSPDLPMAVRESDIAPANVPASRGLALIDAETIESPMSLAEMYGINAVVFPNTSPDLPYTDEANVIAKVVPVESVAAPLHDGFYILPLPEDVRNEFKADVVETPVHDRGLFILPLPWDTMESERELNRAKSIESGTRILIPQPWDTAESEMELAR